MLIEFRQGSLSCWTEHDSNQFRRMTSSLNVKIKADPKIKLTVSWHVELHEVLKVLDVGRKLVNFIVAQAELSEPMQSKKVLKWQWKNNNR